MNSQSLSARRASIVALLLLASACAYAAGYFLRFAGDLPANAEILLRRTFIVVLAVKIVALTWFRIHQGWSRFANFHDFVQIAKATTVATIGVTLVDALAMPWATIPRSVILLDWGAMVLLLAGCRCLPRAVRDWTCSWSKPGAARALIVGVNNSGDALLRQLRENQKSLHEPIGLIDVEDRYVGQRISGIPVLGRLDDIVEIARQYAIDEVLITSGDLPGKHVRSLIEQERGGAFHVKVLPSYEQLLEQRVSVQPRPVAIADLLQRPSIELDDREVRQWLGGRVVLVTGAAGSIGSEICRQLVRMSPAKLLLLDRNENGQFFLAHELRDLESSVEIETLIADINDDQRMSNVFRHSRPDVVFHAAAYKHVPMMESHPGEAVKNIVLATRRIADLADQFAAEAFVMVSTDKAVNPTSVMGSCKRLAEHYVQARVQSSTCRFVTVRFGNVLDSAGSVVPIFREQIARGGPVTVTHPEMVRYFMMIPEAAQLVIQAGAMGNGGEIFVLDMGQPVKILDLARDMIRLSGLRVGDDVEIQITGLRPGEKLFEELHAEDERRKPTSHPKIMVAAGRPRQLLQVIRDIGLLAERVSAPNDQIKGMLAELIPQHEASNLPYEAKLNRLAA